MVLDLAPAVTVALILAFFGLLSLSRFRHELRCHVLELLAMATRRGLPLGPLLDQTAGEYLSAQRRVLRRIGRRLQDGAPIHEALASAPRYFPRSITATLAASESSAHLPSVLAGLARGGDAEHVSCDRLARFLVYPALLALLFVSIRVLVTDPWLGQFAELSGVEEAPAVVPPPLLIPTTWIVGLCWTTWGALFLSFLVQGIAPDHLWVRWLKSLLARIIPGVSRQRLLAGAERFFRALAALVRAGVPLQQAMGRAAPCFPVAASVEDVQAAASLMERGISAREAWRQCGLPEFATTRAIAQSSLDPGRQASGFEALADDCRRRVDRALSRCLGWLQPLTRILFGLLVALEFTALFGVSFAILRAVVPWS